MKKQAIYAALFFMASLIGSIVSQPAVGLHRAWAQVVTPLLLQYTSTSAPPPLQGVLDVQRTASYTGGTPGNDYNAVTAKSTVSAGVANYEWVILGQLNNSATAGQNVAVDGTSFKVDTGSQVGPTWGGNFVCNDLSATIADPTTSCIGAEIDVYTTAATTDANKQRVGLQISAGGTVGSHTGYGILMGPHLGSGTIDTGIAMHSGLYGNGIDMSAATFSGSPLLAPLLTPASSSASCTAGASEWDASFIYICTATNTWKRATLATF